MRRASWDIAKCESGTSMVETAIIVPLLLLLLAGVVDCGRAYFLANEVEGAAEAGAVYGSGNPTDTTDMQTAATLNAPDVSGISATGSWGCECSNGASSSTSCATVPTTCTYNVVYFATVTATATYKPLLPWKGINSTFTITRSATMRSASE